MDLGVGLSHSVADCLGKPALSPEERLYLVSHRLWLQSLILPAVMPFYIIIIKFLLLIFSHFVGLKLGT